MIPNSNYDIASMYTTKGAYGGSSTEPVARNAGKGFSGTKYAGLLSNTAGLFEDNNKGTNADFMSRNSNPTFSQKNTKARGDIEKWGSSSGTPWGSIVAGVSSIGSGVDKGSKDQYGIYKSKTGEFLDQNIDVGSGIDFASSLLNGKEDGEGLVNQLTAGLIGKSTEQRELARRKPIYQTQQNRAVSDRTQKQGALFQNNVDRFTAPTYGRKGMKIRSKYGAKSY